MSCDSVSYPKPSHELTFRRTVRVLAFSFPDGSLMANTSIAFFPPLCSFYAISLLTTLGGRDSIRARNAVQTGEADLSLPPVSLTGYTPSNTRATGGTRWAGSRSHVTSAGRAPPDSVIIDLESGGSEKGDLK